MLTAGKIDPGPPAGSFSLLFLTAVSCSVGLEKYAAAAGSADRGFPGAAWLWAGTGPCGHPAAPSPRLPVTTDGPSHVLPKSPVSLCLFSRPVIVPGEEAGDFLIYRMLPLPIPSLLALAGGAEIHRVILTSICGIVEINRLPAARENNNEEGGGRAGCT